MKEIYLLLLAAAAMFSSPGFADTPKLEGFDLSLAKTPPFPVTAFYDTPENFSSLPVGSLIRKEAVKAPDGALAWRVLYVSERWDGTHVPASGLVVAPKQMDGKVLHPAVAWVHGTTGAARGCAPSLAPNPVVELAQRGEFVIDIGIPYLKDWLAKGYAVVAPDYAGLGSDAVHRYADGVGEDVTRITCCAPLVPSVKPEFAKTPLCWVGLRAVERYCSRVKSGRPMRQTTRSKPLSHWLLGPED